MRHIWQSKKKLEEPSLLAPSSSVVEVNGSSSRAPRSLRDVYPVPEFIPFDLDDST